MSNATGPHQGQPSVMAGDEISEAKAVMIMVHGRGASPESILSLTSAIHQDGFAYVAPRAANTTWYPYSFLEPMERNEPGLSSGLQALTDIVAMLNDQGVPSERIMLLGFSQGACLSLEYAARRAQRFGGVIALSGGLIGPDGTPRDYAGSLDGTPVFIGCSDVDMHIPLARVHESTVALRELGAEVDERIYPGMGHTINDDEIKAARAMMQTVIESASH